MKPKPKTIHPISKKVIFLIIILFTAPITAFILTLLLLKLQVFPYPFNFSKISQPPVQTSLPLKQKSQTQPKKEEYGRLEGRIYDQNGLPLKALLYLQRAKTATDIDKQETNVDGFFSFEKIPPGDYYLRARHENVTSEFIPLRVFADKTTIQNIYLDLKVATPSSQKL
jgi:hypothetical protein